MSQKFCIHGRVICYDCAVVSDAAKRCHDIINAYPAYIPYDQRVKSWVAIRLSDGGSDGVLYETRAAAVKHQAHEKQCAYFTYRDSPNGFGNKKEAQVWLDGVRALYDAGRMPDPDSGLENITPLTNEQRLMQLAQLGVKNRSNYMDYLQGKR